MCVQTRGPFSVLYLSLHVEKEEVVDCSTSSVPISLSLNFKADLASNLLVAAVRSLTAETRRDFCFSLSN